MYPWFKATHIYLICQICALLFKKNYTNNININFPHPENVSLFSVLVSGNFFFFFENCTGEMTTAALYRAPGGVFLRCSVNELPTKSSRLNSFFDRSNLVLQDNMVFLLNLTWTRTVWPSVNVFWLGLQINRHELSKLRKVFKEYCHNTLRNVKFQSIVEIDKTLFGRQVKFHKGYPNRWLKIEFLKSICLTCTYFSFIYLLIMTLKSN